MVETENAIPKVTTDSTNAKNDSNDCSGKGSLSVVIGPNGYGKSTWLENKKSDLSNEGLSTLLLPSEIKLLDEVKDTVDTSKTMEFLLGEIIETPRFVEKRNELFNEAEQNIADNLELMNSIVEEVLNFNGAERSDDIVSANSNYSIKNLVKVNQKDIKSKMGSGQRMQFLLKLIAHSSRDYIFLDEPEKYSHPSLINETARIINNLVDQGKHLYIATHSPKLVSMLELNFSDLKIINDTSHEPKEIPFGTAIEKGDCRKLLDHVPEMHKRYYKDSKSLEEIIHLRYSRQFIEALFAKRVYLCEGINDELFINAALHEYGGYYDDYSIFKTWGKFNIPIFAELFKELNIEIVVLFDVDDENKALHKEVNEVLRQMESSSCKVIEMEPSIEEQLGYSEKKYDAIAFMEHLDGITLDERYSFACIFDNESQFSDI